ncbi:glycine/D-amino acid oxidase-like deaminating enzyme [Neorhizobium galegae]|uniref:NAD(P)/FAD-dependent oxidoreductase n=1 Tax=Neorhizobium galegae TaxID=399 RepID=UPI0027854602|nr:FAD-dependent oxidoreductase [Neorhizobium galegae]MDQ0138077.1 glycine/D-amino acid oxidase-like deaminating enzyme [Neorhizobium galegae]
MEKYDVAVIGSGALGASAAFHLAKAGKSVVLLDKAEIASQTSPRAAGLSGQVRQSELMTKLAVRSVEKIERFTDETGEPMTFYQPGSMSIARLPEHEALLRERVALGKKFGLDVDLIRPEEACERMPFLKNKGIRAVSHMRRDVYLEPVQIPMGYALAAQKLGATLMPNTAVTEVIVEGNAVRRLATNRGEIATRAVVDAAGGWLRLVAGYARTKVPVVPMRHQLMVTAKLEGVSNTQPVTRIIDANVYVRPDKGGLMFGGYERDPMPYDMSKVSGEFRIEDLDLDIQVLKRLADLVSEQFPVFQSAEIAEHRGGLPTMTIDGDHVLGRAPGVEGFYILGGCNVGGLSIAPALGEEIARLVVEGRTLHDLSRMSPSRFSGDLSEHDLLSGCTERYANYYSYRFKDQVTAAA